MGQKTSKSWIFWTHQQACLRPWEEALGTYKTLEISKDEITLILSPAYKDLKIIFPKNSPEAKTLIKTLKNVPKGQKIALLKTDNPEKPLITRIFTETTDAVNNPLALLLFRRSILCVAFKAFWVGRVEVCVVAVRVAFMGAF